MTDGTLRFDPHDPTFIEVGVPFDVLARIRAEQPVYRTPAGSWYLSRYADIESVLKDVETFQADLSGHSLIPGLAAVPEEQLFLSEIPEPRHGKVRRLFNSCFATHRVRGFEPRASEICNRLVDEMLESDPADLHGQYALRIPALVMADIMGLGPETEECFSTWSHDGSLMYRPATPGMAPDGPPIQAFFAGYLARHRAGELPPNHVFSVLTDAVIDGQPLTDREIVTQLHFMVQAGVHTTRALLTHSVHLLLHSPDIYAALHADRDLVPNLVEESLRRDSPVQRTTRRCTRDVEVSGVSMRQGEVVEIGIGSANRDETHYPDAEQFSLDRTDPRDHLGFGAGPHVCPGATLARLEATTAINVLVDRVAEMRPVPGHRYPPIPGSLGHQPIPATLIARR